MNPWDETKTPATSAITGISFETARLAFDDEFAVMRITRLASSKNFPIFVAHVYRLLDGEETPWIISARKAVKYEETIYWSNQPKS